MTSSTRILVRQSNWRQDGVDRHPLSPALTFSDTAELMQRLESAGIPADLRPQLDGPKPNETKIIYSANLVFGTVKKSIAAMASR
jgi:hypothetical protein